LDWWRCWLARLCTYTRRDVCYYRGISYEKINKKKKVPSLLPAVVLTTKTTATTSSAEEKEVAAEAEAAINEPPIKPPGIPKSAGEVKALIPALVVLTTILKWKWWLWLEAVTK